ncbi:MAG: thioredoxin [Anaerolineales bacterium]|nr:thioredoxin [Anaerolineales bacterium]MBK8821463.1 thioredoxin [Anaerolineales bacterium]
MNKTEFQQKISESEKPVIIDFWAPWCGPCKMTKPILDKLAKEYAEKVEFMPINADDSREVLEQFRVFGIPTVITLRNGKEVGRVTGAQTEGNYRTMFEALAEGKEVKVPLTQFDRMLRLGAGGLFIMVGISTSSWLIAGVGGILAFMGIYDRCPIWQALTGIFKRK